MVFNEAALGLEVLEEAGIVLDKIPGQDDEVFAVEAGAKAWQTANETSAMEEALNRRQKDQAVFEKKKAAKLIVKQAMQARQKAESNARKAAGREAAGAGV